MSRRSTRGYTVALMIVIIAAISASVVIFTNRMTTDIARRPDTMVRDQALWLARSAVVTGQRGTHTVQTPHGEATVTMRGGQATVALAGSSAVVTAAPWSEQYTPAP